MKTQQPNNNQSTPSNTNPNECQSRDHDLERVAKNLVDLSRTELPDRVLKGVLRGCEDDIRQEAILLALRWYFRQRADNPTHVKCCYNAVKEIRGALRFCKLHAIKRQTKEQTARRAHASQSRHNNPESIHEQWSPAEIREALALSIQQALKFGVISHANASVAIQVYLDGVTVQELANQLGRSKSSIHQHLTRVRKAIPEIIHGVLD